MIAMVGFLIMDCASEFCEIMFLFNLKNHIFKLFLHPLSLCILLLIHYGLWGWKRTDARLIVRLGTAATAFLHKLQNGIPPWVPLKGHEEKTYAQAQKEACESKRRDMAVLEANDGVWPGVRTPSHALFLWASGSEMTSLLEEDHMPNKYIPKDLR